MFPSNLCFFLFAGQNQKRNATSRENSERPATAHNKGSIYYRFHFNLNTQNWRHDWVQLHPSNLLTISTILLINCSKFHLIIKKIICRRITIQKTVISDACCLQVSLDVFQNLGFRSAFVDQLLLKIRCFGFIETR